MDNVKITNVSDSWGTDGEPNDVEIVQVNPVHLRERLKKKQKTNLEDDYNKLKTIRGYVSDDDLQITGVRRQILETDLKTD